MFPPGWLNRGTMPAATGSVTPAKTIGIGHDAEPGDEFVSSGLILQ
jgi:hypothetical protein